MAKKPYFCDECGTRNTPDSKYCKECGAQLHEAYQTQALTEYDRIDDPSEQERLTQFLDMAFWHTEAGNNEAAVRACKAALALNSNSTTALSLLGSLYEKQGDDAEAIRMFERVLALNPDSMADRAKLDQLHEGVHVQPVRASPVYRWLPPAFGTARFSEMAQSLRERWGSMRRPQSFSPKTAPALYAGVALLLVLAGGLFLIRPSSTSGAPEAAPVVQAVTPSQVVQRQSETASSAPATPPPLVMMPTGTGTPMASRPSVVASVPYTPDPFAAGSATPLTRQEYNSQVHPGTSQPTVSTDAYGHLHALPPLVAVPPAGSGPLPPAPVAVPQNVGADAPISANSDIAHHTVVVRHLTGLQEFAPQSPDSGYDSSGDTQGSSQGSSAPMPNTSVEPPSHIQITVDPSPSASPSVGSASAVSAGGGNGSAAAGESYQQTAFALQQQSNYRQAAATYQKAIQAYQSQIAAGNDRDAATRGLEACQTGLEICRQNQ